MSAGCLRGWRFIQNRNRQSSLLLSDDRPQPGLVSQGSRNGGNDSAPGYFTSSIRSSATSAQREVSPSTAMTLTGLPAT